MQTNLETTLSQLVSFPSTTTNVQACREVIEFIRDEIKPFNLFLSEGDDSCSPWLIATTKDTQKPDILLAAHMDVIPAATELFTMQKKDGKLYGRGVYDMKFAAACYIEFIKAHADTLSELNIGFMFTSDEELGGNCIPGILEAGWRPKVVFLPDGGDNWRIEARAKGYYDIELVAHGKMSHGSRPWEGDNAFHKLMDALQILRKSFPSNEPNDSTLAINEVHAGQAVNQLPDYASAKLDFRSFSRDEMKIYRAQLEQIASKNELEITRVHEGLPIVFNKNSPIVRDFLTILRDHINEEPQYVDSYGGSDARYFVEYDIPSIIIEPTGGGRHATNEWLLAEDLLRYYQLIERWLLKDSDTSRRHLVSADEVLVH